MRIYNYQSSPEKPGKSGKSKFKWKKFWLVAFRVFAAAFLLLALMFLYYSKDLPNPNRLLDRTVPESTKIYARDGSLLYEIHGEVKRTLIDFNQIPDNVKHATIAIEDKDFYKHAGISVTGIIRSVIVDVLTGRSSQGGSTITQQFVKNAILTNQKSIDRKIREAILAVTIDARFSKDDILKLYLNEIPYGRNAYGIEAAAESYFGKPAAQLDLAESAYLAAIPQAPTYYNPTGSHRDALDARKNQVLLDMKDQGYISNEQYQQAREEKVNFVSVTNAIKAPNFVLYVQDYLASKYGETTLQEGGLKVYTTLDSKLQDIAEQVVKDDVAKEAPRYKNNNAALVAMDPKTGQILAMVGSKDYFATSSQPSNCIPGKTCTFDPNVNVALTPLQPGSSFKPYVYGTAFKKEFGYSPASMLMDVVTDFGSFGGKDYIPHNYDGTEHGPVSMRQALAGSLNIPAVKTLDLVGVDNAKQTAHDLGITNPLADCSLSLVLGGCEITLLDHVAAYAAIANEGLKNDKTAILKIEDNAGKILEQYAPNPQQVLDAQAAYELISIMTDNDARTFVFGAHSPLILPDRIVAAKTGTTQNWHDGWTLGFTPSLAAGVWTGNNDGELLKSGADGVVVAAPIWHDFMVQALAGTPAETFTVPGGIQQVAVDSLSGKLPTDQTPSTKNETFASYSLPTQSDDAHISVPFDSATGQPASPLTPPGQIVNKSYTVLHSEKPNDPNWENPVIAWALAHGYSYPPNSGGYVPPPASGSGPSVSILQPGDGDTITSLPFTVSVNAASNAQIARVDISVDGQFYQSLTGFPYTASIDKNFGAGQHTIAAKAVDNNGNTADTSATVIFDIGGSPLNLASPSDGDRLVFPVTLTAESFTSINQLQFYYQKDSGSPQLIGLAANTSHPGNAYEYTLSWDASTTPGSYYIYAQTDTGKKSQKVRVVAP